MKKFRFLLLLSAVMTSAAGADDTLLFSSPSKNIYCIGVNSQSEGGSVECELVTRTNDAPLFKRPADCDLEWGNRFLVQSDGEAQMVCSGDTLRDDSAKVLDYGEGLDRYGIHCTSSKQGIECINDDQHGFKLSKASQEIY